MPAYAQRTPIFAPEFLQYLDDRNREGYCHNTARLAGPWHVVRVDTRFAVVRVADSTPEGVFKERETACLFAACLPALGSECLYAMNGEEDPQGHRLSRAVGTHGFDPAGWLRYREANVLDVLHPLEHVLRSPASLSLLLEAASHEVLSQAGALLSRRLATREGTE